MDIGRGAEGERGGDALHNMAIEQPHYPRPFLEIVEEPVDEYRFRYPIEGRTNGSILGVNSTAACRSYPTLRVNNYKGPAKLKVSCVTKDPPFRPHPHKLVGRAEICDEGVATILTSITDENSTIQCRNLGIQCVKRNEVAQSLELRESMRVDPFRTGFDRSIYRSIGLHFVRLAFQLFTPDGMGRCVIPHRAVVSHIIYDSKSKLRIVHVSRCSGSILGGTQITLLTEKMPKDDVTVVFEEQATGWKAAGNVVFWHKGCGLVVTTPPYRDLNVNRPVDVVYYLERLPSDEDTITSRKSNSLQFEYIPELKPRERVPRVLQSNLGHALTSIVPSPGTKRPRIAENNTQSPPIETENISPAPISSRLFQEIPPLEDQVQYENFFEALGDQNQHLLSAWDPLAAALQWCNNSVNMGPSSFQGTDNQVQDQQIPPEFQQAWNNMDHSSTSNLQLHQNSIAHATSNQFTANVQYPSTSKQTETSIGTRSRSSMEHFSELNHRIRRYTIGENMAHSHKPIKQTRGVQSSVGSLDHVEQMSHNFQSHHMDHSIQHPNISHASSISYAPYLNNNIHVSSMNHGSPTNYGSPLNQVSSTNHGSPINLESPINQASSMNHPSPMNYGLPMYQASSINQVSSTNHVSPVNHASPMNHGSPMNYGSPINYASPINQVSSTNHVSQVNYASPMNHGSPMNYGSPINHASSMNEAQLKAEAATLAALLRNAPSVDLPPSSDILASLVSLEPYENVLNDLSDGIDQLSTKDL